MLVLEHGIYRGSESSSDSSAGSEFSLSECVGSEFTLKECVGEDMGETKARLIFSFWS